MDQHPNQRGVKILLVASCENRDKLRPGGPQLACIQSLPLPLLVRMICWRTDALLTSLLQRVSLYILSAIAGKTVETE